MLYAQISGKDSLRDIENGFRAYKEKMYHLGLNGIHRSTLFLHFHGRSFAQQKAPLNYTASLIIAGPGATVLILKLLPDRSDSEYICNQQLYGIRNIL
jgi:hypothetical protein